MGKTEKESQRAAVRRMLQRWGSATRICKRKQEEIAEINALIDSTYGLHAAPVSGMPHGGGISDPTAFTAAQAEKLRSTYRRRVEDITADIGDMMDLCAAVDQLLLALREDERRVIDLRYRRMGSARKSPWARVARLACVSEDYARELERNGVDAIARELDIALY